MLNCTEHKNTKLMHLRHPKQQQSKQSNSNIQLNIKKKKKVSIDRQTDTHTHTHTHTLSLSLSSVIIIKVMKDAIQNVLQSPHCAMNCLQHVRSSGPGAIVCKSRAAHRAVIMCNMLCYVPHGTKGQLSN